MYCYICGRICDKRASGLCIDCEQSIHQNNEQVMVLALLNDAQMFCPLELQHKIEDVLCRLKTPPRIQLPHWVKKKSP